MARRSKIKIYKWLLLALTLVIIIAAAQKLYNRYIYKHSDANLNVVDRTWLNYHKEVESVSEDLEMPASYLLALIALECSGYKEIPSRFEPHIFEKLDKVREGKIENFEGVKPEDLLRSDDAALKNLASSWGPFQLMGYQCFHLDVKIKQLRGKNSVLYGATWIKKMYGNYLVKKRYKDAFHLHNTGQKYPKIGPPKTHSRYYVPRGLKFMKEFDKKFKEMEKEKNEAN